MPPPEFVNEVHQFKYGNGEVETSHRVVLMPVTLAGRKGIIRASVVQGSAPLLISRAALKKLGAALDFANDTLRIFDQSVPLQINLAGQYVIHLVSEFSETPAEPFAEVMSISRSQVEGSSQEVAQEHVSGHASVDDPQASDVPVVPHAESAVSADSELNQDSPSVPYQVWVQEDSGVTHVPWLSQDGPNWNKVIRRIVKAASSGKVLSDQTFAADVQQGRTRHVLDVPGQHVITEFHFVGPSRSITDRIVADQNSWKPSIRQVRQLRSQAKDDCLCPHQCELVCAVADAKPSKDELIPIIKKLHQNLGHPPNHDMVRILRHGQASAEAIEVAKTFECDFCKSMAKPKIPLPAQANRIHEFNHQIGIDVKNLRGWRPNQKIKALNIVDTASSFQRVIPFFQQETSTVLRRLLLDHWIAWTGSPREIVLDPAQTNLGEHMVGPCELEGSQIRPIAAGAHWQLGKTESHGGWFAHVLDKIIEEHQPQNQEEWLQCVTHAHVKNQMIQVHGYSPQQFVFGKGVHIPDDLLNEPVSIVPATASLTEEALAKSQAMRTTARVALARLQDDRALRVALLARPRRSFDFKPGESVAYWRCQKWIQGKLQQGGRWYGPAIVIGTVGRNLILIHRKQLLRCAPEQVRPSTTEEKQLAATPQAELLGIKSLVEQGNLQSRNYIDLLRESRPLNDLKFVMVKCEWVLEDGALKWKSHSITGQVKV
eukprot:s214_g25.t1